ncbi:MAG: triose-phosphate isomerase [Candidatus Azotimanducaceae bacterium]
MFKPLIVANWKMNGSLEGLREFFEGLELRDHADVVVLPPAVYVRDCISAIGNRALDVGVQNVWTEDSGAYTGEISAKMVRDIGADWVLIGHSERRQLQKESDELVKRKLDCSLKAGINAIVCVGETLEERLSGQAESVVSEQLRKTITIDWTESRKELVIAYEPIWAIGSGKSATVEEAQEMHVFIRKVLLEILGGLGANVRILYGGSVTAENSVELIKQNHVNGLLVGGASLTAQSFSSILNALD